MSGIGKIWNDPVYGFIQVHEPLLLDLIDHPWFQRLRRIRQLGMTHMVYPGATHTRFHHAMGAYHLMGKALSVLQAKGVTIEPEEKIGCLIAILLHDLGHGPYSHALEHTILALHHEYITNKAMQALGENQGIEFQLALQIFKGEYPKSFLHELVSSQLDMDRMDYLTRDSFYTGVSEGVIGYDRLVHMLHVDQNHLVLEEKGIYSLEKFMIARRLMYWQVYLHKTVLAAEHMLILALERMRICWQDGTLTGLGGELPVFLTVKYETSDNEKDWLPHFMRLDDADIDVALKIGAQSRDALLQFICTSLINRNLFACQLMDEAPSSAEVELHVQNVMTKYGWSEEVSQGLIKSGSETNQLYSSEGEVLVRTKKGEVQRMSQIAAIVHPKNVERKYFIIHPKY